MVSMWGGMHRQFYFVKRVDATNAFGIVVGIAGDRNMTTEPPGRIRPYAAFVEDYERPTCEDCWSLASAHLGRGKWVCGLCEKSVYETPGWVAVELDRIDARIAGKEITA